MAEQATYCPFLNRADYRCSEHFTLDQLDHAFAYCFDRYSACPYYVQLLAERQVRRVSAACNLEAEGVDAPIDEPAEPTRFRPARRLPAPVVYVTVRRAAIDQFYKQQSATVR